MSVAPADTWEAVPFRGVGAWRLGTTRAEVVAVLGQPAEAYEDDRCFEDEYESRGLTFIYPREPARTAGEQRAIGIAWRGDVTYDGWLITGRSYAEARAHFEDLGYGVVYSWTWDSLYVKELGLWLHCHEQEIPVDEVTVTSEDYLGAFLRDERLARDWRAEGIV